eukprot:6582420-Pyramimonas_sp.AAC.1
MVDIACGVPSDALAPCVVCGSTDGIIRECGLCMLPMHEHCDRDILARALLAGRVPDAPHDVEALMDGVFTGFAREDSTMTCGLCRAWLE